MARQGLDVVQGNATLDGILSGCAPEAMQADAF